MGSRRRSSNQRASTLGSKRATKKAKKLPRVRNLTRQADASHTVASESERISRGRPHAPNAPVPKPDQVWGGCFLRDHMGAHPSGGEKCRAIFHDKQVTSNYKARRRREVGLCIVITYRRYTCLGSSSSRVELTLLGCGELPFTSKVERWADHRNGRWAEPNEQALPSCIDEGLGRITHQCTRLCTDCTSRSIVLCISK